MADDGFLHKYFLNNGDKRLHKWFHYFDIYERHFARFRGQSPTILEIGVFGGGSLAMWKAYFGEGCRVIGVDIDPKCKEHAADGIEVFIGSQDDPALFDLIGETYPQIDIVLDDGSHRSEHMIKSFEILYDRVSSAGVYMVEDTHTCYAEKFGGGYRSPASFMEFVKEKVDDLHGQYWKSGPASPFTRTTDSIALYTNVVVFERRPQGHRQHAITTAIA